MARGFGEPVSVRPGGQLDALELPSATSLASVLVTVARPIPVVSATSPTLTPGRSDTTPSTATRLAPRGARGRLATRRGPPLRRAAVH